MLADYDSIKEMQRQRNAQSIPQGEWTPKSPEQLKKVMGTVAYRAPEVSVACGKGSNRYKTDGKGSPLNDR